MSRVVLTFLFVVALFAPVLSGDRPFVLRYDGHWYFPFFKIYQGSDFNLGEVAEPDYFTLKATALFPLIKSGPYRSLVEGIPPLPPSRRHWLGTDDRGRDLLSRLIYGLRNSVLFAFATTLLNVLIGGFVGSFSAYLGRRTDFAIQRLLEIISALPAVFIFLAIASIGYVNWTTLILLWGFLGSFTFVQYVRGEALRLKESEFVIAARAAGVGYWGQLRRHYIPNIAPILVGFLPLLFIWNIYVLTGLDYLGIGLPQPEPTLGELISQGRQNLDAWWLVWSPIAVIVALLLSLHRATDAIRARLDVKGTYSTETPGSLLFLRKT